MRRRFNYTSRIRLLEKDITISLAEDSGRKRFYIDIDLGKYALPNDAPIFIEAYDRYAIMHYSYGTVGTPSPPKPCFLDAFPDSDSFLFRIKIVSSSEHSKILALAKSIKPLRVDEEQAPSKSLLRTSTRHLHGKVWQLEFYETEHPVLYIDDSIDAGISLPRQDIFFQALVFPTIIESVLKWILRDREYVPTGDPDPDDEWKEQWLEFAASIPGSHPLPVDQEIDEGAINDWVEECARLFSENQKSVRKVKIHLQEILT
ncbi:MAG: hypothetical protein ACRDHZ_01145 [Ktedonobacteraceae bacterium]